MMFSIRVISLANSPRRSRVQAMLEATGYAWSFVDGIDLRSASQDVLEQHADVVRFNCRAGRSVSPAEIGCALAHRRALEVFLRSDDERCLILEDDAQLTSEMMALLPNLLNETDLDLVSFFSGAAVVSTTDTRIVAGQRLLRIRGRADHALAYFVNRRAASELVAVQTPRVIGLSDWPMTLRQLRAYLTEILLVEHLNVDSHMPTKRGPDSFIGAMRSALVQKCFCALLALGSHHFVPLVLRKVGLHGLKLVQHTDTPHDSLRSPDAC